MGTYTNLLWNLAGELLPAADVSLLRSLLASSSLDYRQIAAFDDGIAGPSLSRLDYGGICPCDMADRDVFRPLQYCDAYFASAARGNAEWFARDLVQMSGLHLESLVKRIGRVWHLPLGGALREARVRCRLDAATWSLLDRFTRMYNAAKHYVSQPKDTHLFSVEDAAVTYFVSRALGNRLYPMAGMTTDLSLFADEGAAGS